MIRGHDAQIAAIRDAFAGGRPHHAWLLQGPRGIGKASLALAAARRLLAEAAGGAPDLPGLDVPADHPAVRLIDAEGSPHPDFVRLERLVREKSADRARSISIDQVRGLARRFATPPTYGARRIVLIDAIDDLERAAANALLKNLEEPPAGTVFLLVSHAPGRLLPTIRSRCRVLRFGRLDASETEAVLRDTLPQAPAAEIAALAALADGAPGHALRFAGLEVAALDAALSEIAREGDRDNGRRLALARTLAPKAAQPRYEVFLERAPALIAAEARTRSGAALARAIGLWAEARRIAAAAAGLSLDPQTTVFEIAGLVAGLAEGRAHAKA